MKILALVLAGGEGSRLRPLTESHAKPALAFVNGYRLVDFVLSNLVNSGITSIYVLAQYKPQSLIEHIRAGWSPALRGPGRFVNVVLPETGLARGSFLGTADAVYKNLHLCTRHAPDLVAVFAADHVYRMDVGQMVEAHLRSRAQISVAAVPIPIAWAPHFGIIAADADGRIREFQEKPASPAQIPGRPGLAYASMGNYLFEPTVLAALLEQAARRGETDFGRHILPRAIATHRVVAYDFAGNRVPGILPHEEPHYWRDVGTIAAYRAAQRDASGHTPKFSLANARWPIGGEFRDAADGRVAAAC
ncbi:MAG: sugar phosphate nucleotidyltransferase [Burkholderiaceae bacterium]